MQNDLKLVSFTDASHATDLRTRRSIIGYAFCLAGGAVCCKCKLQATVASSSTEAEFIISVSSAKTAKYLRAILKELNIIQVEPTVIHVENQAALLIGNNNRPADRTRHIDIKYFAI